MLSTTNLEQLLQNENSNNVEQETVSVTVSSESLYNEVTTETVRISQSVSMGANFSIGANFADPFVADPFVSKKRRTSLTSKEEVGDLGDLSQYSLQHKRRSSLTETISVSTTSSIQQLLEASQAKESESPHKPATPIYLTVSPPNSLVIGNNGNEEEKVPTPSKRRSFDNSSEQVNMGENNQSENAPPFKRRRGSITDDQTTQLLNQTSVQLESMVNQNTQNFLFPGQPLSVPLLQKPVIQPQGQSPIIPALDELKELEELKKSLLLLKRFLRTLNFIQPDQLTVENLLKKLAELKSMQSLYKKEFGKLGYTFCEIKETEVIPSNLDKINKEIDEKLNNLFQLHVGPIKQQENLCNKTSLMQNIESFSDRIHIAEDQTPEDLKAMSPQILEAIDNKLAPLTKIEIEELKRREELNIKKLEAMGYQSLNNIPITEEEANQYVVLKTSKTLEELKEMGYEPGSGLDTIDIRGAAAGGWRLFVKSKDQTSEENNNNEQENTPEKMFHYRASDLRKEVNEQEPIKPRLFDDAVNIFVVFLIKIENQYYLQFRMRLKNDSGHVSLANKDEIFSIPHEGNERFLSYMNLYKPKPSVTHSPSALFLMASGEICTQNSGILLTNNKSNAFFEQLEKILESGKEEEVISKFCQRFYIPCGKPGFCRAHADDSVLHKELLARGYAAQHIPKQSENSKRCEEERMRQKGIQRQDSASSMQSPSIGNSIFSPLLTQANSPGQNKEVQHVQIFGCGK